ncbi:glycosyltransferase [Lactiplantibacillus plantarum]|uniref:glycosyltransferase n=1 Tax=Lactiplantibacillus plantarum TaxID=1590 RepID=UPI002001ADCD|nr:glycosyltransferase [Lactiplantibacillus plantarum]MCK3677782.1 glycosyltransferase [Lactiplantibacillus plantarum]
MKICFVANGLGLGGLERVVTTIGENLNSRQFSTCYYSLSTEEPIWKINGVGRLIKKKRQLGRKELIFFKVGKATEMLFKGKFNVNRYQKRFIQEVTALIWLKKIDVLVLTSAQQISAVPLIKKNCGDVKIVLWIHQSYEAITQLAKNFSGSFMRGIKSANQIVCLTKDAVTNFSKYNRNTTLIYNPLSFDTVVKSTGFKGYNVAFVSRITFEQDQKGLDLLVKIIQELPVQIRLNVAGKGNKKSEKRFLRLLKNHGISKQVNWNGPKMGHALVEHYKSSSVFISTSRTEGFSLVILEALSLGLPVISFKTAGAVEILQGGRYGVLVDNYDTKKFAQALLRMLNDHELLAKYQALSLERAKDFKLERILQEWRELFVKLVEQA